MVKDHYGNLIIDNEGIIKTFQIHFENILNIDHKNTQKDEYAVGMLNSTASP